MKQRFSEGQIIAILREAESAASKVEVCRKHGISEWTYYLSLARKVPGTERLVAPQAQAVGAGERVAQEAGGRAGAGPGDAQVRCWQKKGSRWG